MNAFHFFTVLNYPKKIVEYILGEIKAEQLLDSVDYFHRNIKERQLCQIEFYLGLNHLRQGEEIKSVEHLRNCISNNCKLEPEHHLAANQLDRWEYERG